MPKQRMAGEDVFQKMSQKQQADLRENLRVRSIMERQRQRDMAATKGEIVPFSKADII